jgi:hypothetical protein
MRHENIFHDTILEQAAHDPLAEMVPELIAGLYDEMRPLEKQQLLEYLLRPLSLLALAALAGGKFARLRIRNGEVRPHIRVEETQTVCAKEIAPLVRYLQQAHVGTLDTLIRQMQPLPSWRDGWPSCGPTRQFDLNGRGRLVPKRYQTT